MTGAVRVRAMRRDDVEQADHIHRLSFGTFFRAPEPTAVFGAAECVRTRYAADPTGCLVAHVDGRVVGSMVATRWGSFAANGPLSVHPDFWNAGIGTALFGGAVDLVDRWGVSLAGLYTFVDTVTHIRHYQRFGFVPQRLTAVLRKEIRRAQGPDGARFSTGSRAQRARWAAGCRSITDALHPGLDVGIEIDATYEQRLGETILVLEAEEVVAFAVCHCDAGEAGSRTCFVKFGAVRPAGDAGAGWPRLVEAIEGFALRSQAAVVVLGTDTGRTVVYADLLARGYIPQSFGIRMHRPDTVGYGRSDCLVVDDLR